MAAIDNLMGRCRWSVLHYGPSLGGLMLDAFDGLLARLRVLLGSNAAEAQSIDARAEALVSVRREAAKDGRIDAKEARRLARAEAEFLKITSAHRDHAHEMAN